MPILVKIDGLTGQGDARLKEYADGDWFVADSCGFGIGRELRRSSEKGGTLDINIGVGEFGTLDLTKQLDSVSSLLAQYAANGNSAGDARIDFVRLGGERPFVYQRYALRRCFVASWSSRSPADEVPREEVKLAFNKIACSVAGADHIFSWDITKSKVWPKHGLKVLPLSV